MEKRFNKVLLLVTIALLGPIGLGTVAAAAQVTPQSEGWAEASSEALTAPASAIMPLASVSTLKTQNPKLKTPNSLTRHWTYAAATTLYERTAYVASTVIPSTPLTLTRLLHHLGLSAGGLPN